MKSFQEITLDQLDIHIFKKWPSSYTIHKSGNIDHSFLNLKPDTLQLLENKVESLCNLGIDKGSSDITHKVQNTKEN